jgi:DNA-directed RNA polymerase specialized sigma24 family protein
MSEVSKALNKAFAAYQEGSTSVAFRRLWSELLNLAKGATKRVFYEVNDAVAQDIAGDILLELPRYRGKNRATFSTWAYGIAKRKAVDELRRSKGGRRRGGRPETGPKKHFELPPPEELADLYWCLTNGETTKKEVLLVRRIIGEGLPHPLSAADRQTLSRLSKKFGLRDVTRMATNKKQIP